MIMITLYAKQKKRHRCTEQAYGLCVGEGDPWLIRVNVSQKPLQYCKVIRLQLIKINGKKKENTGY